MLHIIAYIYLALYALDTIATPFFFGQERKPYSPASWFVGILVKMPMVYILYQVIKHL